MTILSPKWNYIYFLVFACVVIVRYIRKKIVFKNIGYTPKQVHVYIFFLEDFVDVGTSATQLCSKPSDCSSLVMQCLFDECSSMNHTLPLSNRHLLIPKVEDVLWLVKKDVGICTVARFTVRGS